MTEMVKFSLKITGPDGETMIALLPGTVILGRQVGNDILLDHPRISRRHAQIEITAVSCTLTDLDSANGTMVNDKPLPPDTPLLLNDGDIIKVPPFMLTVQQEIVPVALPEVQKIEAEPEPELSQPVLEPEREDVEIAEPEPDSPEPEPDREEVEVIEPESESPEPEPEPVKLKGIEIGPPQPPRPAVPEIAEAQSPGALPGLALHSSRLLSYLPDIYHTEFMSRFLGLFESVLTPIEWNIDNFDLFLDPGTAPIEFLPWLAQWYEISFDDSWGESQRRQLLSEAHQIYNRRGTKWALARMLEIYTGHSPDIDDLSDDLEPFTFTIKIPLRQQDWSLDLIERMIDMNKPAYTTYKLKFKK